MLEVPVQTKSHVAWSQKLLAVPSGVNDNKLEVEFLSAAFSFQSPIT